MSDHTEARLLEMVFPDHANHLGTLFGGQALAWMDKAAFIAASRYARRTVVTARSEQLTPQMTSLVFHVDTTKNSPIGLHKTIAQAYNTVGIMRNVVFVGHHNDGIAAIMKILEQCHDPIRRFRVKVTGGLIGKYCRWLVDERPGDGYTLALAA